MAKPLVSIVIPTFDRPELFQRALRSAQEQTVKCDIVVVNDGAPLQDEPSGCRYIETQRPDAPYLSWLQGVYAAIGQYVVILADDDWFERDFVSRASDMMGPSVAVAISDALIHFRDGTTRRNLGWRIGASQHRSIIMPKSELEDVVLNHMEMTVSPHCCMFHRADVLDCLLPGRFPGQRSTDVRCGNDLLLFMLPLLNPDRTHAAYIADPLVHFDAGTQSVTIDALANEEKRRALLGNYADARAYYRAVRSLVQR